MQFFAFNLENFTSDRIFYTGTACGACGKYIVKIVILMKLVGLAKLAKQANFLK